MGDSSGGGTTDASDFSPASGADAPATDGDDPATEDDTPATERFSRWLFLDGSRLWLSAGLLAAVLVGVAALIRVGVVSSTSPDGITALCGSLVGGMLPFITVVLAINQLILSQEFGTTGAFMDRLEETRAYRERIEERSDVHPTPVDPSAFLRLLLEQKRAATLALSEDAAGAPDELRDAVERFAAETAAADASAIDALDGAAFGTFEVISVILDYDDPLQLQEVRRLRAGVGADGPAALADRLDRVAAILRDVHVARQYFKTVHVQQELADLSKRLLYAGTVALLAASIVVLGYENLLAFELPDAAYAAIVSAAVAALFSPFAVLLAYVLRIATVARRTAADFGPFVLQRRIPEGDVPDERTGE